MREIIVEIPPDFEGRVRIILDATNEDASVVAQPNNAQPVDRLLQRFNDYDPSAPHQELADHMQALGFTGEPPRSRSGGASKEAYVRWVCEGTSRKVMLYQNSKGLVTYSEKQLAFATTLPGAARGPEAEVRYYYGDAGKDAVFAAAEAFRAYGDQ